MDDGTGARDLDVALRELARAPRRPYLDERAEAEARAAYYRELPDASDGRALYAALSRLVTATHTRPRSYQPSVHVYPWVDLHPDLRLRSLYSGATFDAGDFIRADAAIGRQREAMARARAAVSGAAPDDLLPDPAAALEAALPFNCEHVVPQSWFAKREPMRGDLHHLFACESGCNSFRGNTPYFDFPEGTRAVRHACGRREPGRFEPGSGKGPAARAVLYVVLRYPSIVDDAPAEVEATDLPTLLGWHRAEPPGLYERHRNQAIAELQGNRNPLIDHPEWAEQIAFAAGLG